MRRVFNVKERLLRLLNIKNIVTLVLTIVFAVLALRGSIKTEQFMMIFASVTAFYFSSADKDNK